MAITIAITSGSGYFGSVYTQTGGGAGQWYADETPIAGATGNTHVMLSVNEGKAITYREDVGGAKSNQIKMWTPGVSGPAGLLADYDVSRADLITQTGGVVDAIASRVGSWTAVQATAANKPTYAATGRNGLPVITGDGVSDSLDIVVAGGTVLPVGTATSTMAVVAHYNNQTGDNWRSILSWGSGGSGLNTNRTISKSSGEVMASGGAAAEDAITAVSWPNLDHIGILEVTSTGKRLFADGASPVVKAVAINTAAATVARILRSTTDYWRGGFQEALIYNVVLSDSDRAKLEGYLAHKWGQTGKLPVGHAYKTAAPKVNIDATIAATGLLPTTEVLVDGTVPGPINISITSGTGYAGSVYTRDNGALGQWYASNTPIPGATGMTYTMEARYEGKLIHFRAHNGFRSNRIDLFVPSDLSGLVAWFDAYDDSTLTLVSNAASEWRSRIGALVLQQATAGSRPPYSATARNGRPGLQGDGSTRWMQMPAFTGLPSGAAPSHKFAVGFFTNLASQSWRTIFSYGTTDVFNSRQITKHETTDKAGTGTGTATAHNFPASAPTWLGADKIVAGLLRSGKQEAVVDGQYTSSTAIAINTPAVTRFDLFRFGNSGGHWNGWVQEFFIFDNELSTEARQKVEGYMAAKWGLRALLPVGHPYKSQNPPPGAVEIAAAGYLPTAAIAVDIPVKASLDLNGLLPTMTAVADTEAPGPITISVTSGNGYVGSIYTRSNLGTGYWYVGGVRQTDETGTTLVMRSEWEGRQIQWRATNGSRSNIIDLFTPEEIPGLLAWFDAKTAATVVHAAGVVSQWSSRKGAWTATQATAGSRPTYSATGRNSQPAILANGSQWLAINTVGEGLPAGANQGSIVALGYFNDVAAAQYRPLVKYGTDASADRRGIGKISTDQVLLVGGLGDNIQSNVNWRNADAIAVAQFHPVGAQLNANGGNDIVNFADYSVAAVDAYFFTDAANRWNGSVQEVFFFNRNLTTEERQSLEGYLATRWGVRGLLPVDHPYKNSNPAPKTAYSIPAMGYLPTAAISGVVPFVVETFELNGYLPTMAATVVSAPMEFDVELNSYLPTMEASAKQQTRTWLDLNGLLPTMEAEATLSYQITADLNGYLPTAEISGEFPVRATIDAWGYLPVAEIGGASSYPAEIEAYGILPTAEVNVSVVQYQITAELTGYLPTAEIGMAINPKVTAELEGYLPFSQGEIVFPTRITAELVGYLPTAEITAGTVYKLSGDFYGYLPVAEIEVEPQLYMVEIDAWGYLPVAEIGGESVYEVEIEGVGLLPFMEAVMDVPQNVSGTIFALGYLPTAEIEAAWSYGLTLEATGFLGTMEAMVDVDGLEVTLDVSGFLPTMAASVASAGPEPERPEAFTPGVSSANSSLAVGGGPVLSYGSGLKVG